MTDDMTPLPIASDGNASRLRSIEFDEADALMIASALLIATTTARMGGGTESARRLAHYRQQFLSFVPASADLLDRRTDVCEIAIAADASPEWTLHRVRDDRWRDTYKAVITIGDRYWLSKYDCDDAKFEAIAKLVETIAPFSCVRGEREDEIGNIWNQNA